ncbi:hypothetical protein CHU92_03880 [Flavobacterium cyanobacteriorum]|uniref:Uncharacterized protein n=1 Tax=Flavobacterium cyanobacteriorum TaxID=2022802 RepID=A0A255ZP07_9FLAO|nr:hypothetical protein CHU92_03880 [Flavobacterium cyanobacteriorum]
MERPAVLLTNILKKEWPLAARRVQGKVLLIQMAAWYAPTWRPSPDGSGILPAASFCGGEIERTAGPGTAKSALSRLLLILPGAKGNGKA